MLHQEAVEPATLDILISLQKEILLQGFVLVGGTSLALQLEHRKSVDIDLFTQNQIQIDETIEFLEQKYDFNLDYSSTNTIKGSIHGVKIDLITHNYPYVNQPITINSITLLSKADIAAMKLNAIAGNGTRSKDFIDMYFLLKEFTLKQLIAFYQTKYSQRNSAHVLKSLVYFEDISRQDWPELILEKKLSLKRLKSVIEQHVKAYSQSMF